MKNSRDEPMATVHDIAQARRKREQMGRRGAKIMRGHQRRALPHSRAPRVEMRPEYPVPGREAVALRFLVDGDVVAVDAVGRRSWAAQIWFVPARPHVRRQPTPENVYATDTVTDEWGSYRLLWMCPPPERHGQFQAVRDEWSGNFTERRIYEWEPAELSSDTADAA